MRILLTFILSLFIIGNALPCQAQRNKNNNKNTKPVIAEETPQQRMFKNMLPSTAKIMFIDSVVVEKKQFLNHIPLNAEAGNIEYTDYLFNKETLTETSAYTNEYGDRRIYAMGDTIETHLFSSDLLGNTWSEPRLLSELEEELHNPNFPFLMTDGITLFFSAQGETSLGGYDIYMTLFDSEEGVYYKPENYGLPFNSTANDYMVAFSETDSLGWLVTDRYQPKDSVCIYSFVPAFPRKSFAEGELSDKQLNAIARLQSISDTWSFGDVNRARQRYENMIKERLPKLDDENINFHINDNLTYLTSAEFKTQQAQKLYSQLQELESNYKADYERLESLRQNYHQTSASMREQLKPEILRLEKLVEQEQRDIKQIKKQIRITENKK